jgi:hypothetical protein
MTFDEIHMGRLYGLGGTARRKPGEKLMKVKALDKRGHQDWRRRRVKVRHMSPPPEGLEEWVSTGTLVAKWGEVNAMLRDETRAQGLLELAEGIDDVVEEAIDIVLQATGEESLHSPYRGTLTLAVSRWESLLPSTPVGNIF